MGAGGAAYGGITGYAVAPDGSSVAVSYGNYPFTRLVTPQGAVVRDLAGEGDSCADFTARAFSVDGSQVYGDALHCTTDSSAPAVGRLAVDGSDHLTPEVLAGTDGGRWPSPVPVDGAAPAAPGAFVVHLDGTHPLLSWTDPTDADFSHVVVERYAGTQPAGEPTVLHAPWHVSSLVDTVTRGATYTYVIRALDGAGNASATLTRTMRALAGPLMLPPALASTGTPGPDFGVRWGTGNQPVDTRYTVQWRRAEAGAWSSWLTATSDPAGWFGRAGVPTTPWGGTYRFRAITMDVYGNPSHWGYGSTVVPFDQTRASCTGAWWSVSNVNDWRHGLAGASHRGDAARFHLSGRVLRVIGDRCPQCGPFRVYLDGALVGTFGSHRADLRHRQVLATVTAKASGSHWVRLVDAPGRYGWQLRLDALAASS